MNAVVIKPNGETSKIEPNNGEKFSLEEMQKIVEGYIETIELPGEMVVVVNEEGLIRGLKFNYKATVFVASMLELESMEAPIVGNVLICNSNQFK